MSEKTGPIEQKVNITSEDIGSMCSGCSVCIHIDAAVNGPSWGLAAILYIYGSPEMSCHVERTLQHVCVKTNTGSVAQ